MPNCDIETYRPKTKRSHVVIGKTASSGGMHGSPLSYCELASFEGNEWNKNLFTQPTSTVYCV